MKFKSNMFLFVLLGLGLVAGFAAQKAGDLVGTWSGLATLEGMDEANELVMVLEMKEGTLVGHMTDQFATMTESKVSETKLEGNVFTFAVDGNGPNGETIKLVFKMEVDGDSMSGSLEIPEFGMAGGWNATKQK